jgi:hypothetical protein
MPDDSPEMLRLREARDAYADDVKKAERDLQRAQNRLESARLKLAVADDMVSKVQKDAEVNVAAFKGMGKYANSSPMPAILDIINTHAGIDGMTANDIKEILINEGFTKIKHIGVTTHVVADRLQKKGLIEVRTTKDGKRFFKTTQPEKSPVTVAA